MFLSSGTSSSASIKSATIEMYTGSSSVGGGMGGYAVAVDSTLDTLSSVGEGESEKSGSYVSGGSHGGGPLTHTVIPPPPRGGGGHYHHHHHTHMGHHHTLSHYNPGQHRHPPPSHSHVVPVDEFDEVSENI